MTKTIVLAGILTIAAGCGASDPDSGPLPVAFSHNGIEQFAGVYDAERGTLVLTTELTNALAASDWILLHQDVSLEFGAEILVADDLTPGDVLQLLRASGAAAADLRIESHEWLDGLTEEQVAGSFPAVSSPKFAGWQWAGA